MSSKANDGALELHDTSPTRRQFVRGALGVTAAAGVTAGSTRTRFSPAGEAQAVAPVVAAGYALAGAAAGATFGAGVGWTLREFEVIGSNPPPEGLTPEALEADAYQTLRTRASTNRTDFHNQREIVRNLDHSAYVDGKLAAIEKLNEQASQSEVADAAHNSTYEREATIKRNILKTFQETVLEYAELADRFEDHPDTDGETVASYVSAHNDRYTASDGFDFTSESLYTVDIDLPDGSTFNLTTYGNHDDDANPHLDHADPTVTEMLDYNDGGRELLSVIIHESADENGSIYDADKPTGSSDWGDTNDVTDWRERDEWDDWMFVFAYTDWVRLVDELETTMDNVRDGLTTWVDTVYDEVQSGEIEIEDLLTPRERAEMMTDDEEYPQAVADLLALNVPVDLEREATINIPEHNATLRGTLGINDSNATVQSGETYDPETDFDGSVFFTYDISEGYGDWTQYEEGIDGGVVTFTSEPYVETEYHITTVQNEVAVVDAGDFEQDDDSGDWTVDVSGQLDDAIVDIEQVDYYAQVESTQYETVQLRDTFEVEKFTDSDGNEHDEADFTQDEPQTDENYITQDEWDEMEQRNEELIEQYEDALNSGGGIDLGGWSSGIGQTAGAVVAGVLALIFAGFALGGE